MKSLFKKLFFDRELVTRIKATKTEEGILYQHLISGKITFKEYLAAL